MINIVSQKKPFFKHSPKLVFILDDLQYEKQFYTPGNWGMLVVCKLLSELTKKMMMIKK